MSSVKSFLLLVVLMGLLSTTIHTPPIAAQGGLGDKAYNEWSLVEARNISEEIEDAVKNALPDYIFDRRAANDQDRVASRIVHTSLAPNGEYILISLQLGDPSNENTGSICLYPLATQIIECHILAERAYFEAEALLRWSPDGRYVLFHTDFSDWRRNSDLWLFDTQTITAENLTPDADPTARWDSPEAIASEVYFDGAFVWQVDSQAFYFWRYIQGDERPLSVYLMHMQIGNTEPTEIAFFEDIQAPVVSYPRQVALSPDEAQMAFVTYETQPINRALWIFDFQTGEAQQIITGRELKTIWNDDLNLFLENVQWLDDQLFIYLDRDSFTIAPEYIRLNPATLEFTTMVELGVQRVEETVDYLNARAVRWGALSADGRVLFYFSANFSEGKLFTLPSSLDGEPHLVGDLAETLLYERHVLYQITSNGRLLVGGMLFQFE